MCPSGPDIDQVLLPDGRGSGSMNSY
jgi:hypothetical protein